MTLLDVSLYQVLRHVGQAQPLEGGIQTHADIVEDELAFDAYFQLFPSLLELPREDAAVGRRADGDAVMPDEIARGLGTSIAGEVVRRTDHCHSHVRTDAHRDHVLGDLFTQPDPGVVALGHDIRQAVVHGDLDADVWMAWQDLRKRRLQDRDRRMLSGRNPQRTRRLVPEFAEQRQFGVDLFESGRDHT